VGDNLFPRITKVLAQYRDHRIGEHYLLIGFDKSWSARAYEWKVPESGEIPPEKIEFSKIDLASQDA